MAVPVKHWVALAAVAVVVALAIVAWAASPDPAIAWSELQLRRDEASAAWREHPAATLVVFAGIYLLAVGASLPVSTVLGLAAGAICGPLVGTVLVSCLSTAAACVAFALARWALRERVRSWLGARFAAIDAGIARDGAWYLAALRLAPWIPYSATNLAMGLTRMRLRTFWLVSQAAMLPANILFVCAGASLARIEQPSDALSFPVLATLTAVALLPLLLRPLLRRRVAPDG